MYEIFITIFINLKILYLNKCNNQYYFAKYISLKNVYLYRLLIKCT